MRRYILTVKALELSLSKVERALAVVLVSMSLSSGGGLINTICGLSRGVRSIFKACQWGLSTQTRPKKYLKILL